MKKHMLLLFLAVVVGIASIAEAVPIDDSTQNLSQSADSSSENSLYNPDATIYCILTSRVYQLNQSQPLYTIPNFEAVLLIGPDQTSGASVPVPEPSSALLLLVGIIIGLGGFIFLKRQRMNP